MKFIQIITLSLIFLTISCKESKEINTETINEPIIDSTAIKEKKLQEDLVNKPKLFLKYWSGMTSDEFYEVSNILNNEGVVKHDVQTLYTLGDESLSIDMFYSENDVFCLSGYKHDETKKVGLGINLWGFTEKTYNTFKDKYNIPNYIEVRDSEFILEDNPLYLNSNENEYTIGENHVELTEADALQLIGGEDNRFNYSPSLFEGYTRITTPYNFAVIKDDVAILFEDVPDISVSNTNPGGNYASDKVYYFYINNDKRSAKRIVKVVNYSSLRVTYVPKSYYEERLKNEKKQSINSLNNKINEIKVKEKRKENSLNEI
jgi:hypothetical protein